MIIMNGIIINGSMEYHYSSSSFYFFTKLYWIAFYVDFDKKKMFPVFLKIFLNRTRPGFKRIDEKFLCSRPDLPGKDKIKNSSNVVKIKVRFRNPAMVLPFYLLPLLSFWPWFMLTEKEIKRHLRSVCETINLNKNG